MYQILETTWEEKYKMYSKLSKKELITMLIEANRHLSSRPIFISYPSNDCNYYFADPKSSGMTYLHCGLGKYAHK